MDKFLEIVYESQLSCESADDSYKKCFEPLLERLKSLLSETLYTEIEENLCSCAAEYGSFHATEGMKIAIGVMNGTHVMKI